MLAHLPHIEGVAGVELSTVVFDYIYWGFGFLRLSTTGLVAQAGAQTDSENELREIFWRSVSLAFLIGSVILIFRPLIATAAFTLLSADHQTAQAARSYYNVRIWGAPAAMLNYALIGWFLGRAQSGRTVVLAVLANLSNIVLNYLFIVRSGWGAYGAGLASMLAQYIQLGAAVFFLLVDSRVNLSSDVPHSISLFRPVCLETLYQTDKVKRFFALNVDLFIRTFGLISVFAVFRKLSLGLGKDQLAVNALLLRIFFFIANFIDGAAIALESMTGRFVGLNDHSLGEVKGDYVVVHDKDALNQLIVVSIKTMFLLAIVALLPVAIFPGVVVRILTSHADLIVGMLRFAYWLIPLVLCGTLAFMYDGLFLGMTVGRDLRQSMWISIIFAFLPLATAGVLLKNNHYLWAALTALMIARSLILFRSSQRYLH